MLWPGVTLNISLLLLLATCDPPGIRAEGSVGCLFSDRLCSEDEWCYDDLAFGRCLRPVGDVEEDDLFRFNLEREGLHELSSELRRLFALGYRWSHSYTQCRLQAMLFAFKNGLTFEPDSCSHLSDNDLEGALKALEGQVELDPREVAIIKYTPSVDDPHAAYADEVFYPPVRNGPQQDLREKILAPNAIDLEIPDPYADYSVIKREWIPQMRRRSAPRRPLGFAREPSRDAVEFLQQLENEIPEIPEKQRPYDEEMTPVISFLNDMHLSPKEIRQLLVPDNRDKLRELLDGFDYGGRNAPEERFTLSYNTPDGFRAGWESKDALGKEAPEDFPESRVYYDEDNDEENPEYGSGNSFGDGQGQEEAYQQIYQRLSENEENLRPAVYSEGGVVWSSPEKFKSEDLTKNSMDTLDQILTKFNLGFKRPERLDVKKPGPPFDPQVNEIARKAEEDMQKQNIYRSISKKVPPKTEEDETNRIRITFENDLKYRSQGNHIKNKIQDILNLKSSSIQDFNIEPLSVTFKFNPRSLKKNDVRKLVKLMNTNDFKDGLEALTGARIKSIEYNHSDDQAFVYVELKNQLKSWNQGDKIIKKILDRLYLEPSTFSRLKVNPYWVSFKVNSNSKGLNATEVAKQIETIQDQLEDLNIKSVGTGNKDTIQKIIFIPNENQLLPSMMKKGPPVAHPHLHELENSQDFVHVGLKTELSSWKQGDNIIKNISNLLGLEPNAFSDGQVDPYAVVFKVKPNSRGLNATEVARRIELIKDQLEGVKVVSVGIGNKQTIKAVMQTANETQFFMVISMVCGILAACIIATILLIIIRRHLKARQKLRNLSKSDTEPSKDYQDLCRSRMAAKTAESSTVHGRITSLSRESEQSPSSRSSTSSWSEEPALHNMDISTGHMVLSYMEDHLKNKDRLEQEWVALCAYVAEPCETTIANKKENKEKNRYPDIVPYDHSRVVLNELSNANGSNYINASSITDHDPRNPAYIATQGPLPHTAPDFWQLIWEQGAVVIVMLTRLTEGGAAMCHRYWPEEGSELYHIYEVHLVSEHIWCDDYLVRSFYLKNVKTGETRTVTQFHFLSWPEAGVPSSTKALLEFRRKVNKSYRGRSCPIVVHCSDGAGRTGTYCLIDMVLSRMAKGAKEIDIAATLEHLRDQRIKMVATKQQFEFVLTAVAEEVHAILKALPAQNPPEK